MSGDVVKVPGRKRAKQQQDRQQNTEPKAPTRFALHLRRQAANRIRESRGWPKLPQVRPGSCPRCEGWGVVGKARGRCPMCGGTGR